ncbi:C-type lectin domain-containing protein [Psychromonas sp. psych-6C06]|uniref:C-type lectin domain-containing protein n=1 Tax=Psychromonas sp. psych-6C06 TaxID=2058089 RepID=UPI00187C9F64|nr:C-type lectin domain-containing protein [Psychromonas sp. psych-6C06]
MFNKQIKNTLFVASSLLLVSQSVFASPMYVTWDEANGGNGHHYALTELSSDWLNAEQQSIAEGGHLVAINSAAEQQFLNDTFLSSGDILPFWIGLTDKDAEGDFIWSNGDDVTFTNWKAGEPNNYQNEDYAVMNWDFARGQGIKGTWNDVPLQGTTGFGGSSNGQYYGVIEISSASVPAPAGLALMLFALCGLGFSRKFKKV